MGHSDVMKSRIVRRNCTKSKKQGRGTSNLGKRKYIQMWITSMPIAVRTLRNTGLSPES